MDEERRRPLGRFTGADCAGLGARPGGGGGVAVDMTVLEAEGLSATTGTGRVDGVGVGIDAVAMR